MAYSDMGDFMPSKSAYVNPGEYETTQRNVALERGSYMAKMDAFYSELDETMRQFDETAALEARKIKVDEGALALQWEQFDFTSEIDTAKFLEGVRQFDVEAALKQQEIDIEGAQTENMGSYYKSQIETDDQYRLFNWIGGASSIFKDGGMMDDWSNLFG